MSAYIHTCDDNNPRYLFSGTHTALLIAMVSGQVNPQDLAARELAARGLDHYGKWVGFDRAAEILAEYFENA